MTARDEIAAFLAEEGIPYRALRHEPAPTIGDCAAVGRALGAVVAKNFFLTTRRKKLYCLLVTRPDALFRTSDVSRQAGTPRLCFADGDDMMRLLNVRPGSVSPLGLLFDRDHKVRLLLDEALLRLPELAFHPNDNTETFAFSTADVIERLLPALGRAVETVSMPDDECDEGVPKNSES